MTMVRKTHEQDYIVVKKGPPENSAAGRRGQ